MNVRYLQECCQVRTLSEIAYGCGGATHFVVSVVCVGGGACESTEPETGEFGLPRNTVCSGTS